MEFTGGIHFGDSYYGALNATWPFAHLEIRPEKLELSTTFLRSFTFRKEDIAKLSRYAGFFSVGLRIEHALRDDPPFIVFWTFNFAKVKKALIECGYCVQDSKA